MLVCISFTRRLVAGSQGSKRPVLSSWHKAYQKRTISIDGEIPENTHLRAIEGATAENNYPLALRPDPHGQHPFLSASSTVETCDTAGYLELVHPFLEEDEQNDLVITSNIHPNVNLPSTLLTISSVFLGAVIIALLFYYKQKQKEFMRQLSSMSDTSVSSNISPPPTPQYHQIEQPPSPPFQSRYELLPRSMELIELLLDTHWNTNTWDFSVVVALVLSSRR